jgi:hypothetical protein
MDAKETRFFAQQLMKEVWEPFDSEAVSRFFHRDVVGWHGRADSSWVATPGGSLESGSLVAIHLKAGKGRRSSG